jgi:hypothetical protein
MKPTHLGIEAVVCAAPGFLVGLVGALIFLYSGASMLGHNPLEGAKGIAGAFGIVVSLWQYTSLAARTIVHERYEFRVLFWLGVCFGLLGVWWAINLFGFALGVAIGLPIVGASIHFIWLQLKRR